MFETLRAQKIEGFKVEKVALFSHGGAIHDTIASVERHCL